jgi:hypothetical protein
MQKTFSQKLSELEACGEIFTIVDKTFSASDVVRLLGYTVSGSRTKLVNELIRQCEADISHWRINGRKPAEIITKSCPNCNKLFSFPAYEPKTTCSYSCSNTYFRSGKNNPNWKNNADRSYRKKAIEHYGASCSICGFSNLLALDVHHIDEDRTNNELSNLRVLCCNCHAITHRKILT